MSAQPLQDPHICFWVSCGVCLYGWVGVCITYLITTCAWGCWACIVCVIGMMAADGRLGGGSARHLGDVSTFETRQKMIKVILMAVFPAPCFCEPVLKWCQHLDLQVCCRYSKRFVGDRFRWLQLLHLLCGIMGPMLKPVA